MRAWKDFFSNNRSDNSEHSGRQGTKLCEDCRKQGLAMRFFKVGALEDFGLITFDNRRSMSIDFIFGILKERQRAHSMTCSLIPQVMLVKGSKPNSTGTLQY